MPESAYSAAGRVAVLTRRRTADDPDLIAAREAMRAERWRRHMDRLLSELAELPPLDPQTKVAIAAAILRPAGAE